MVPLDLIAPTPAWLRLLRRTRFQRRHQNISRWMPSVVSTLLAISSIEVCVVLNVVKRSLWKIASAADTSRLHVSSCE